MLLRGTAGLATATALLLGGGTSPLSAAGAPGDITWPHPNRRSAEAFRVRLTAARQQAKNFVKLHPNNGDEDRYKSRLASYTKGLPHDRLGEVDRSAYRTYLAALASGEPAEFEAVPLGGDALLANPQAAYAYPLVGTDSHGLAMPPAPRFASTETASEAIEVYWQALTRDVPFSDYPFNSLIGRAVAELSRLPNYAGVTRRTLFRGGFPGDDIGPYISQFLWLPVPCGALTIEQKCRTAVAGDDYLTDYDSWLAVQNGALPADDNILDPDPRYIASGRALGEYVHRDFPFQSYLNAALIVLGYGPDAWDRANPYLESLTQSAGVTFGPPFVLDLVTSAARLALQAAWFQKWLVHRRLRPEVYGGRVQNMLANGVDYPIDEALLRQSDALEEAFRRHGTYLLPQAYPEGSPNHPAYPAGHAVAAGACTTVLKAFFNEDYVIPGPVEASADGSALDRLGGVDDLTVGGELNKLAGNIALGRDTAGVHWRSDGIEGIVLGEAVAIAMLSDLRLTYNEDFDGFSLTRFSGERVTV